MFRWSPEDWNELWVSLVTDPEWWLLVLTLLVPVFWTVLFLEGLEAAIRTVIQGLFLAPVGCWVGIGIALVISNRRR